MATERIQIIVTETGSRIVRRNIAGIGASATSASSAVATLRNALLTLGVIQGIRVAIRTMAEFEQAISTVRAVSGATALQFQELSDAARELGATTRFTATQAAEGLLFLARAGFTVDEQLETIRGTLLLAQAGALDLGRAADIASNVLRGFRLNTDQTARVVDVLALAANRSNTNVGQLGDALKFVAPIASGLGISLEETVSAVGALSDAGLQASIAGTGLRRVLAELESPAKKNRDILRQIGLELAEYRPSVVGAAEAVQRLRDAGIGAGDAFEIFGQRGGPAFEVLSSTLPRIRQLTDILNQAEGTVEDIAEIMDANLNGALLRVRSAIEAVVLSFSQGALSSGLQTILNRIAQGTRFLAANIEIVQGLVAGLATATLPLLVRGLTVLLRLAIRNPFAVLAVGAGTALG